jgi:hypothetical protein
MALDFVPVWPFCFLSDTVARLLATSRGATLFCSIMRAGIRILYWRLSRVFDLAVGAGRFTLSQGVFFDETHKVCSSLLRTGQDHWYWTGTGSRTEKDKAILFMSLSAIWFKI